MLADPQSITISGTASSLPRTSTGVNSATYMSADGNVIEDYSHTYGKRIRRMAGVRLNKVAPDPLISAQNIKYSARFYIVMDEPITGFTVAERKALIDGFFAQLNASSGAMITSFLGGQS